MILYKPLHKSLGQASHDSDRGALSGLRDATGPDEVAPALPNMVYYASKQARQGAITPRHQARNCAKFTSYSELTPR